MNIQELIEKYKKYENALYDIGAKVACQKILQDLEKLDEPEKIKVPKFVADWIKHSKTIGRSLFGAMSIFEENTEIKKWMQWADNQETFARAWLDGYEVEEEKRYRVKLKSNSEEIDYLVNTERNGLRFYSTIYTQRREHTRKELEEAGFGWVFDCPGIEIEEVE